MNSKLSNRIRILFICILLVQIFTLTVFAADSPDGLTSGGEGVWNSENNTYTVSATGGCSSTGKASMTLTNSSNSDAVFAFTYTTSESNANAKSEYTVTSDKSTIGTLTSGQYYSLNMQAEETITFKVETKQNGNYTSSIVLSDISFTTVQFIDIQLQTAANGSYTVTYTPKNSTEAVTETVTENRTVAVSNAEGATLVATPASEYKFVGWRDTTTGKLLSTSTTYVEKTARTVKPEFISSSTPAAFQVKDGGAHYYLNDALGEVGNSGTIIVVENATVLAGDYTIPSGVTLLIPYDSANLFRGVPTEYSFKDMSPTASSPPASPEVSIIDYAKRTSTADTEYRRLTMASGANIVVDGALEVSGQTDSYGRGQRGAYSVIQMEANTSITVNGTLYAWGYIRGSGTVTVNGTVYEHFDVLDYPHAGAGGMDTLNTAGVFGMRDYSFNSIEVESTYNVGGLLKAYICITGTNIGTNAFIRTFIGNTSDAVIQLTSGTIKKSYVNDRQKLDVSGAVNLNSISISMRFLVINYKMDSAATSGLPFARNWDVTCTSGGSVTLNNSILVYAGATITIDQGATVIVPAGKNIYIMDYVSDPVDNDTKNIDNMTISVAGDALVDINGEVQVTSGDFTLGETTCKSGLYTTYSGTSYPSITSSKGTGKITITGSVGTATTVPVRQGYYNYSADVKCNITPAKLRNSNNSIVETANGGVGTYNYNNGFWHKGTCSGGTATCTKKAVCTTCSQEYGELASHTVGSAVYENPNPATHECEIATYCTVCNQELSRAPSNMICLDAINASADAEIILMLYFTDPCGLLDDTAEVTVTMTTAKTTTTNDVTTTEDVTESTSYTLSDLKVGDRYLVSQPVASGEMTSPVTVTFTDAQGNIIPIYDYIEGTCSDSVTKTVTDYAERVLAIGADKQKNIIKALVTYGGYSQINFNTNADNPAYSILGDAPPELGSVTIEQKVERSETNIGVTQTTQNAYLESAIRLRVYFTVQTGTIDDYTFKLTSPQGGSTVTTSVTPLEEVTDDGIRYYVDIKDIPAAYLDNTYTLTVTGNGGTYTVETSVFAYLKDLLDNSKDEKQINAAKAMYLYGTAASEFFDR